MKSWSDLQFLRILLFGTLGVLLVTGLVACNDPDRNRPRINQVNLDRDPLGTEGPEGPEVELERPDPSREAQLREEMERDFRIERANNRLNDVEQLFHPQGFIYANRLLDQVLELDPENKKAQFYKAVIKPFLYLKGFKTLSEPIRRKSGVGDTFDPIHAYLEVMGRGGLKEFLEDLEGVETQPIRTMPELQAYFNGWLVEIEELRQFLKNNLDLEFEMMAFSINNPILYSQMCAISESAPGVLSINECPHVSIYRTNFDYSDNIIFQNALAGFQMFVAIWGAYNMKGLEYLSEKQKDKGYFEDQFYGDGYNYPRFVVTERAEIQNSRQKYDFLFSQNNFGELNETHKLSLVQSLGVDFAEAYRWAQSFQDNLCPEGDYIEGRQNRPKNLFKSGWCSRDQFSRIIPESERDEAVKKAFGGESQRLRIHRGFELSEPFLKETEFHMLKPFISPQENILGLRPSTYDACERVTALTDPTFLGVFPEGDGNDIYAASVGTCRERVITDPQTLAMIKEHSWQFNEDRYEFISCLSEEKVDETGLTSGEDTILHQTLQCNTRWTSPGEEWADICERMEPEELQYYMYQECSPTGVHLREYIWLTDEVAL